MGVDYSSNAGIGYCLDIKQVKELCAQSGNGGDLEEFLYGIFEGSGFNYFDYGNHYSGNIGFVAIIEIDDLFKEWDSVKLKVIDLSIFLKKVGFSDFGHAGLQHGCLIS